VRPLSLKESLHEATRIHIAAWRRGGSMAAPDVVLAIGGTAASRTVPIVFVNVADPASRDLVAILARPGKLVLG
jgi:ABC-type uncharacterized transport system substrate-binding protein